MGGFHGPEGRSRLCRVHLSYCRISGGCNCAELDIAADFLSTGGRTDAAWPCRGERLLRTGPESGAWNGCQLAPFLPGVDRKSVVWGKSVSVRVDLGCRRILQIKNTLEYTI